MNAIDYARVGAPLGSFDMARMQYIDAYGDAWKVTPSLNEAIMGGLWTGVRTRDNALISSDAPDSVVAQIDVYAKDTRTNVAATGSVLGLAAAGGYVGYRTGGVLSAMIGALGAAGLAIGTGLSRLAGQWWNQSRKATDTKPTAVTKGCSCSRTMAEPEKAAVGRSPYSLHHANASRFKAAGELSLLEDHMINDPCPDCMNKHAMTASRLMAEAATLDGGEQGDVVGAELIETIRQRLKPEADIPLANQSRDIRKKIQEKLKLSHTEHTHADH